MTLGNLSMGLEIRLMYNASGYFYAYKDLET